jgi:dTDP-4-amino-4,6-dideoxygalactose transaminase
MITFNPHKIIYKYLLPSFFSDFFFKKKYIFSKNIFYTGSGKSSISLILSFLKNEQVIKDKTCNIDVPKWMCYYIYNIIQEHCNPTFVNTGDSKLFYAYHQYGFPQNMDKIKDYCENKKLILIEDCAHVLRSYYKKKALGTFGDFSIYSFSKFVYCHSLGGVSCNNSKWEEKFKDHYFVNDSKSSKILLFLINLHKYLSTNYPNNKSTNFFNKIFYNIYSTNSNFSKSSVYLLNVNIKEEIDKRKILYEYLIKYFSSYSILDHLEKKDVIPWAIPLFFKKNLLKIQNELKNIDIETGVYHFDINRFSVNPKFKKMILLPITFELGSSKFEKMLDILKKNIN